jgi:hypothetical protein
MTTSGMSPSGTRVPIVVALSASSGAMTLDISNDMNAGVMSNPGASFGNRLFAQARTVSTSAGRRAAGSGSSSACGSRFFNSSPRGRGSRF